MIYPSIDKLLAQVGSKYLLVNVVSKRARDMQETEHYQMKEKDYFSKKTLVEHLKRYLKT
jgi:DNA-directed RNA polymerase omega subunit